jgi:hypothetical protein
MDSEYLVRARLGMVGERSPGLGFRPMSGSPKNSYLLDSMPTMGVNKRPRPVDADAVTLDNFHASKRYLTEVSFQSRKVLVEAAITCAPSGCFDLEIACS